MAEFYFALQTGSHLEWAANPAALPIEHLLRMVGHAFGFTAEEQASPPRDSRGTND